LSKSLQSCKVTAHSIKEPIAPFQKLTLLNAKALKKISPISQKQVLLSSLESLTIEVDDIEAFLQELERFIEVELRM
jgi:hypothetical protein